MSIAAAKQQAPAGERMHLAHVEALRAIAALLVFVNHAYAQTWNPINQEYATGWLSPLTYSLVIGHLSVSVFIVISGFCLALPVVDRNDQLRGGAREFMKRRARRILPPYYAALALCLGLIATIIGQPTGSLWDVPIVIDKVALVSHLLLLQDVFGTGRINYVFWSIAVEWHLYFVFPLLVLAVRRFGMARTAAAALSLGYAISFAAQDSRLARANPHYLGLFALGMLAAYVARSPRAPFAAWRESRAWGWAAAGLFLLVWALCYGWGVQAATKRFLYLDLPIGLMATAVLVQTTSHRTSWFRKVLDNRQLIFIGSFSYSLYLVHAPLLQIMWLYMFRPLGLSAPAMFGALMLVGLPLVLAFAWLFFKLCEEPFLKANKRAVEQLREPAPVASVAS